jgi:hypothetical protein
MRATIDGPATGSTAELGGWDAVARHRPRHAGRDPTIPTPDPERSALLTGAPRHRRVRAFPSPRSPPSPSRHTRVPATPNALALRTPSARPTHTYRSRPTHALCSRPTAR